MYSHVHTMGATTNRNWRHQVQWVIATVSLVACVQAQDSPGCMNPSACNYNPDANVADSENPCDFTSCGGEPQAEPQGEDYDGSPGESDDDGSTPPPR